MNRKIAPAIKDAVDYNITLKPYEHFELDNGVPVYVIEAGAQEVLQVEWVYYAGNENEQRQGIAAATNYLLKNGTTNRTALEINEAFEYYGAYCNRACYNETATISLHTLTKHTDKLLPVIREMMCEAIFPQMELDIYLQNARQRLLVNLKKAEFVAGRLIDSYLYGKAHPYGSYTNPEDLDLINVEDIKSFYKQFYLQGQVMIFASGKMPEGFRKMLNEQFGTLGITKPAVKGYMHTAMPATEKKYRIQNDADAVQGAIRIASPFPNRHHPDFKKAVILNNVLGGFFGSRLMSNIREDKGYTYGIHSYLQNHIQQSAWMISTEAGKDVCDATISEVYKEMQRLREELIPEEELMLVRNYMIGGLLGDLDGPFHIIAKWKNIILNGLDEQFFYDSVKTIREISAPELKDIANRYLLPELFYELVVY